MPDSTEHPDPKWYIVAAEARCPVSLTENWDDTPSCNVPFRIASSGSTRSPPTQDYRGMRMHDAPGGMWIGGWIWVPDFEAVKARLLNGDK